MSAAAAAFTAAVDVGGAKPTSVRVVVPTPDRLQTTAPCWSRELRVAVAKKQFHQSYSQTNPTDRSGWKLGLFEDNPGIEDKACDTFYTERRLKNKVHVTLCDGSKVYAHIIHWNESGQWFCVTFSPFWDRLEGHTSAVESKVPCQDTAEEVREIMSDC